MNLASLPDGRLLLARLGDIYPLEEADVPLEVRRVLGLARLAQALERELELDKDLAMIVAATLFAPMASA